ncbi:MAG: alpha/beta fold hydrolase [Acidobacteriaceae bacterium]
MAFLTVGKENSADIDLYYEDRGTGKPVLLIHCWPLNGSSWERQTAALLASGYRVITYDRRGFGRSSQPSIGYDYDTLAHDTSKLMEALHLQDVTLVGNSMGGGEVARYLGKYAQPGRVTQAVFLASITPALRHSATNPEGVDPGVFEDIKQSIAADHFAFFQGMLKNFYNYGLLADTQISEATLQASFATACSAGYHAVLNCVDAWLEDFRQDIACINIPTLVIHGDSDQMVSFEVSARRMTNLIPNAQLHVVKGGPHGIFWTHATEVNQVLLKFLAQ